MATNDSPIYLDYNATTPLDPAVKRDMIEAFDLWRNPSSSYAKDVKEAISKARKSVGDMIHAKDWKSEILFTSGGTESNNWILMSVAETSIANGHTNGYSCNHKPHIITSNIEHDAIKFPLENLMEQNRVEVTFAPVYTCTGTIDVEQLLSAIKPNTVLVTLMLANNETGILQPVAEIGHKLLSINQTRTKNGLPKILLHSDAAQAIGKICVNVQSLLVDFMTIVGHKFYGPRIGALYIKSDVSIKPLFYGGGQECGLRPGTENTPCIIGLGTASELVFKNIDTYQTHLLSLSNYFKTKLREKFTKNEILINFDTLNEEYQLPNTISVSLIGSKFGNGKEILKFLESRLQASIGSACHSNHGGDTSSSILILSGLPSSVVMKTIRLSLGRETTMEQLDQVLQLFHQVM